MTRTKVLRGKIKSSGVKYIYLADKLGLSYYGLKKKIDNKANFNVCEVKKLCKILNITSLREKEYIFFAEDDD